MAKYEDRPKFLIDKLKEVSEKTGNKKKANKFLKKFPIYFLDGSVLTHKGVKWPK